MGNCIHQSSRRSSGVVVAGEGRRPAAVQTMQLERRSGRRRSSSSSGGEHEDKGQQGPAVADQSSPPSVVKVKMVLTKGELGWLVARLKAGDRRLEDVLHEMAARKREAARTPAGGAADGWRPSLESIVECPAETATESAAGAATNSTDDYLASRCHDE
jgi:hypothetical protein